MDNNKEQMEEVQTDDITSADTEKKDNKKKIIIISSIVASVVIIGLISWLVVTAIDKGKEFIDEVSDSMNNITENIPSLELDITLESETTTELEITTEEPTTEEPTTEEPTTEEPTTEEPTTEEPTTEEPTTEETTIKEPTTTAPKVPTEEDKLNNLLKMDKGSYKDGYYHEGNSIIFVNRRKDDLVMQAKNKWIKDNYGTSFIHNGIEFCWDETNQSYYWINKYGSIHYMTSTSTSTKGQYYKNFYSYRIADYLGFYGTDFELYHSEDALNDAIYPENMITEEKMTVDNMYENNTSYLKQLGWSEDVEVSGEYHFWDFISTEEVPVGLSEDGYITINIKYPTDTKYKKYKFTIEEYNQFVVTHKWIVSSDTSYSGFGSASSVEDAIAQGWTKNITKYLIVEE